MHERESNRKLPKMFGGKNIRMTKKRFNQKTWRGLLKIDACMTANNKIILS